MKLNLLRHNAYTKFNVEKELRYLIIILIKRIVYWKKRWVCRNLGYECRISYM